MCEKEQLNELCAAHDQMTARKNSVDPYIEGNG